MIGDTASCFNFGQNRNYVRQLDMTCNSNISFQNEFTAI